jgi:hypothetical protein
VLPDVLALSLMPLVDSQASTMSQALKNSSVILASLYVILLFPL